ncbi:unnamed protein product [Brugia pahangi]|uniref:Ovule protein n=1 Tax=Brugia pahangi TaxID=6280 RepID=A0A0N4TFQ4_BRUPA|nr:unnamed protein product [Brugia pahangi]
MGVVDKEIALVSSLFHKYYDRMLDNPHRFIQSHKVCTFEETHSSYLDCSMIAKCCPCPIFSFRQFLKSCCCDSVEYCHFFSFLLHTFEM